MREYIPIILSLSLSQTHTFSLSLSPGLKYLFLSISGIHYRKSCASSGACLIASSGYQQFCTGKLNSVCITCCNTPLCNGPRQKRRPQPSAAITLTTPLLPVFSVYILLLSLALCWQTFTWGMDKQSSAADNTKVMNRNCLSWHVHFEMYILWGMLKLCTVFVFFLPLLFVPACLQSSNTTQHWEFLSSRSHLTLPPW